MQDTNSNNSMNVDMEAINKIKRVTGVNFSDEQIDVLKHHGGMCILACAGSGKALVNGTKVLTTRGYRPIEKLIVGEDVYDEAGNIQRVTGVFPQGSKEMVRVRFSNGHAIDCCEEHLWTICQGNLNGEFWETLNTTEISKLINSGITVGVPAHSLITHFQPNESNKLLIEPYMIGLLAAFDPSTDKRDSDMTGYERLMDNQQLEEFKEMSKQLDEEYDDTEKLDDVSIMCRRNSNLSPLLVNECFRIFGNMGIRVFADESSDCIRIVADTRSYNKINEFYQDLISHFIINENGESLHTIPFQYLINTTASRIEVLRGLIDASGTIKDDCYSIPCHNSEMASSILFAVDTLGFSGAQIMKGIDNDYFCVNIPIYAGGIKLHTTPDLEYEYLEAVRNNPDKPSALEIVSITMTGELKQMTCISVTGNSKLYLTERCIPTHNTTIVTNLIAKRIMTHEIANPNTLLCTTYSKSGAEEMEIRLNRLLRMLGIEKKVEVRTLHAVYLKVLRDFGYPTTVIEAKDRRRMLSEAVKDVLQKRLDEEEFRTLDELLSYQVNNLLSDAGIVQSYVYTLKNVTLEQYTKIRTGYNNRKIQNKVIDFDDMQLYMYSLLCNTNREDIINYCRSRWTDLYIDEAQDMSKIQYAIVKKMISDPNRLVVIGDDDQCLLGDSRIITNEGTIQIKDIDDGMSVLTSTGMNGLSFKTVDKVSSKHYNGDIIRIRTESGKEIVGTPEHIGFARGGKEKECFYTYIIYKYGLGYKIGYTNGVTNGIKDGVVRNSLSLRMFLDKGDRLWVIKTSKTLKEAMYYTHLYGYKYGIPLIRWAANQNPDMLNEEEVKKLYSELDTESSVRKLFEDLDIDWDYPLKISSITGEKCKIDLKILGVNQDYNGLSTAKSILKTNTRSKEYADILSNYIEVIEHRSEDDNSIIYYECKLESSNIDLLETKLKALKDEMSSKGIYLEVDKMARFGNSVFRFMPFKNMRVGMSIPTVDGKNILKDKIISITREEYSGEVYDISVPETRNFIANGTIVHNCIYQWRGADPSIILSVCADYDITRFVLSTNYRCPSNIVDRAAVGIKNNKTRSDKSMIAHKQGGDIKIIDCGSTNLYVMSKYAYEYIRHVVEDLGVSPDEIAILSRNNNHLILINNLLFKQGIHCTAEKEMKMTKYPSYYEVKNILDFANNSYTTELTENCLMLLCTYMSRMTSGKIAKLQSECGFNLSTILYMLMKYGMNLTISDDEAEINNIKVPAAVRATISGIVSIMKPETQHDIIEVYTMMREPDIKIRAINLLNKFLTTTGWRYKNNLDKARTVCGLVYYVKDILENLGYEQTKEYLKVSERYDNGSMAVPGAKVCMSTMHGAKGREWEHVIIFADDNVSFPSFQGINMQMAQGITEDDISVGIDEGRRLHYVAMTRARKELAIFTCRNNPGLYMLEAFSIFGTPDRSNDSHIIKMAQGGGVYPQIIEQANKTILSDTSQYMMEIDVSNVNGSVGDSYILGISAPKTSNNYSQNQIQTGPSFTFDDDPDDMSDIW